MQWLSQFSPAQILFINFSLTLFRYFLFAGAAFGIFWVLLRKRLSHRRLQKAALPPSQIRREIGLSILTVSLFMGPAALVGWLFRNGYTQFYLDPAKYGWGYLAATIPLLLVVHDAYFYWIHRWMHQPRVFRVMHRWHHLSSNPTPWAAFAFHPTEALLQSLFMVLAALTIPSHLGVFIVYQMISLLLNVYGHVGYDLGKAEWMNTSRMHNDHHRFYHGNFSLYFTHWDRWCGTQLKPTPPG